MSKMISVNTFKAAVRNMIVDHGDDNDMAYIFAMMDDKIARRHPRRMSIDIDELRGYIEEIKGWLKINSNMIRKFARANLAIKYMSRFISAQENLVTSKDLYSEILVSNHHIKLETLVKVTRDLLTYYKYLPLSMSSIDTEDARSVALFYVDSFMTRIGEKYKSVDDASIAMIYESFTVKEVETYMAGARLDTFVKYKDVYNINGYINIILSHIMGFINNTTFTEQPNLFIYAVNMEECSEGTTNYGYFKDIEKAKKVFAKHTKQDISDCSVYDGNEDPTKLKKVMYRYQPDDVDTWEIVSIRVIY